jgi:hypothetical protein
MCVRIIFNYHDWEDDDGNCIDSITSRERFNEVDMRTGTCNDETGNLDKVRGDCRGEEDGDEFGVDVKDELVEEGDDGAELDIIGDEVSIGEECDGGSNAANEIVLSVDIITFEREDADE